VLGRARSDAFTQHTRGGALRRTPVRDCPDPLDDLPQRLRIYASGSSRSARS
jgi:hypothetical protein